LQVAQLEAPPALAATDIATLQIGEDIGAIGFSAGAGVHHAHGTVDRLTPVR